jgi:hypothetical protein
VTWARIRSTLKDEYVRLTEMKNLDPAKPDEEIHVFMNALLASITKSFQQLQTY